MNTSHLCLSSVSSAQICPLSLGIHTLRTRDMESEPLSLRRTEKPTVHFMHTGAVLGATGVATSNTEDPIQFSFIYIAPVHNRRRLEALWV